METFYIAMWIQVAKDEKIVKRKGEGIVYRDNFKYTRNGNSINHKKGKRKIIKIIRFEGS